jgi:O-antigen/teichoic acid export membrane protein
MDKALKMGKVSATGSFQLFIGKVLSTLILAVGTIIVGIFILESDYGLYAIALIPATTMLLFQTWGTGSALVKYCASLKAANKEGDLRKTIVAGLTFNVATGIALTVLSLLIASFIASTIFSKPESAYLITIASITILFTALFTASQSIFIGFERMKLSTITTICQATVHGLLSPLLVYLGYGALGALTGYTVAYATSGIIAVTLLYFTIFRKLKPDATNKANILQTLKPMLKYGIPLAIATIISGGLIQFYSFTMAAFVDVTMIGNYRIATNFAVLLTFFAAPISTVLFPAFSKLDPRNEHQLLKTVFAASVKYTALFLIPATMAMMVLSQPIISTIYGGKWPSAPFFLTLYVITNLLPILGTMSMGSLLTALGETKMLMKMYLLTLCIGVPLAFILIPSLGILGLITVSIVAGVPSMIIGLYWIWKRYETKAELRNSAKIFLASSTAAIATYLLLSVLNAANWVLLATGVALFLAIYLTAAPLIGAINQTDVNNLRAMFSGLGIISKILEIPLILVQKVLNIRSNSAHHFSPATEKALP